MSKAKPPEVHVVRFGVPIVRERQPGATAGAALENFKYVRRDDLGPQVLSVHMPHVDVAPLLDGLGKLEAELADRGREFFIGHLLTETEQAGAEPWEIAARHMYSVIVNHSHAGVSWGSCEHDELRHAYCLLAGCDDAGSELNAALTVAVLEQAEWPEIIAGIRGPQALKMQLGYDQILGAVFTEATQPAAANYVAQTENNTAEANTNTTLAEEITTASGGLIRKQAAYAHTTKTLTAELKVTFTANGSDSLPSTVNKVGYFNKSVSGGTMVLEDKLSSSVTYKVSGDNATITNTITLS